jgi:predicted enzyme related to lactoylglutathione lyase
MNRIVHFEIHAKYLDKAQRFYQDVFGWDIKDMGPQMGNYRY